LWNSLLDPTLLSQIAAVVLLGDPKLWWRDPDYEGIATKLPGVPVNLPGGLGPRQPRYMPDMPTDWDISPSQPGSFPFRSYCADQDPICNATRLDLLDLDSEGTMEWLGWLIPCVNLDANVCQHLMYAREPLTEEVANWFIERLGQDTRRGLITP
jgi:hypothetical protein